MPRHNTQTWIVKGFISLLILLLVGAGIAACNDDATSSDGSSRGDRYRVVFVTHGQANDPFWSVVQNGARQAGRDVGVRVEYQAPESFDMVGMAQLIDAAVASRPDGLVVSLPDVEALSPAVRNAIQAGIPVITINSGHEAAVDLGVLAHVGQTEYEAGFGGGEQLAAAGVRKALCVNNEVGNAALDIRCQGFTDALKEKGGTAKVLGIEMGDPTESTQRVRAALASDPNIDGLLALGPTSALAALQALRDENKTESIKLATFDLSPEILSAIEAGEILFAIDQQQYLQGYLPVVFLSLLLRNENIPGNEVVRTGPAFVTRENVARLAELTRRGTR